MKISQAPYGITTESFSQYLRVSDRRREQMMARMWAAINRGDDAPILPIAAKMPESDTDPQHWLSFHEHELPEWMVRIVNSVVIWVAMNSGGSFIDQLWRDGVDDLSLIRQRLRPSEFESDLAYDLGHECTDNCRQRSLGNTGWGWGVAIMCVPSVQSPARVAVVCATLWWFTTPQGRAFYERFNKSWWRFNDYRTDHGKRLQAMRRQVKERGG